MSLYFSLLFFLAPSLSFPLDPLSHFSPFLSLSLSFPLDPPTHLSPFLSLSHFLSIVPSLPPLSLFSHSLLSSRSSLSFHHDNLYPPTLIAYSLYRSLDFPLGPYLYISFPLDHLSPPPLLYLLTYFTCLLRYLHDRRLLPHPLSLNHEKHI